VYELEDMMNDKCQKIWITYSKINCDDDQEEWKGYSGPKQKNDRKAHDTGIISYKAVDEKMFCIGQYYSKNFKVGTPLGESLIKLFESMMMPNVPYLFCADAGPLSSVPHAEYLASQGRKVLMSFVAKHDGSGKKHLLTKFLDTNLQQHEFHTLYNKLVDVQS
jgi:hypothetical protein